MIDTALRIRVDTKLRSQFYAACKARDLTASQVLRAFMRSYVSGSYSNQQIDLFLPSDSIKELNNEN